MIWKWSLRQPVWAIALVATALLAVTLAILGGLTLRNLGRLDQIEQQLLNGARTQAVESDLERMLVGRLTGVSPPTPSTVADLERRISRLATTSATLVPDNRSRLQELEELVESGHLLSRNNLVSALILARDINDAEIEAQGRLVSQIHETSRMELELAALIFIAIVVLTLGGIWSIRGRILGPLDDLRSLISRLASGDFTPVATDVIDPSLVPLFQNYNQLVSRLEMLEAEHRSHARSLQSEVRQATQALLEQHRALANAERLAAVGEVAAGVAHELRNPLAGILMSLNNLRRESKDPDLTHRLDLMTDELERMTRLLNGHLSQARHKPEPLRPVCLNALVHDLITLLRYQTPDHIHLEADVQDTLEFRLPRDRIRQALLNLVLNSVEALGDSPGTVTISARNEDGRLVLEVADDGPGFPAAMLRHQVRPFATARERGTGLGLAMVKRAVEDLGGRLELGNREPHGARVRLTIPGEDV